MAEVDGPEGTLFSEGPKSDDQPPFTSLSASPSASPLEETEGPMVPYGHVSKIKLSEGRQAVFSLPDRLSSRDAQKLKGALQGLATIIDSMIEEGENESKAE
jgi:hypothetical protein